MKVIFCDFDGTLKSVASIVYHNRRRLLGLDDGPSMETFCPIACSNLEYILEECPDVQVVVSSNWRKNHTVEQLQAIFSENMILPTRIIGTTPQSKSGYRGIEIEAYLNDHPEVTKFAIIDDEMDVDPYQDRLVKVNSSNGLSFTDAEKAIELLGGSDEKEA